jgi:pyridoxamine 5'-phosphate oxidase
MTAPTLPPFYDDLDLSLAEVCSLLSRGAPDRTSAAHHPIVATIDRDGRPQQRVMILRECDWGQRKLRFHSDSRSHKIVQIYETPEVSVLAYDERAKIQIRLSGRAWIDTNDIATEAWQASTRFARRCYMAERAPGTEVEGPTSGLPDDVQGIQPEEEQIAPARKNFATLIVGFDEIDFLYLANAGHRRARWRWDPLAAGWSGRWLVP